MTDLSDLRAQAMERDGYRCRWPGCPSTGRVELAHLEHRGLGGYRPANRIGNLVCLCAGLDTADHHGILDGRTVKGRRREVAALLDAYLTLDGR